MLQVYIFLIESVWWTHPATWKHFGVTSQADENTNRPMAYNQGFYNLFLGLGALIGLVIFFANQPQAGQALVLFTTAAMVLAATGSRQRVAAIFGQHSSNTRPTLVQHSSRVRCRSSDSCCSCSPELNSSGPRVAPSTLAAHFCVRGVCSGARREHKVAPRATGSRTVAITA